MSEKTPLQWSQHQQPLSTLNTFNVVIITSISFVIRSLQHTIRTSSNLKIMKSHHLLDNHPTPFPYFPTRITPPGNHQRNDCAPRPHACIPTSSYIFIFKNSLFRNIRHQYPTATTKTRSTPSSVPCDPPITQVLGQPFNSLSALYLATPPFKILNLKQHIKFKTSVSIFYYEARDRRSKSLLRDRIVESFVVPVNIRDYHFP